MEISVRAHIRLSCLEGWKVYMMQIIFFFLSLPSFLPRSFLPSFLSSSLSLIIIIAVDTHLFWFDATVMTQYGLKKKKKKKETPQTLVGQDT